jgi:hydrogenase expression/formation protein HypE
VSGGPRDREAVAGPAAEEAAACAASGAAESNAESGALACPLPLDRYPAVTLAHGGGGRLMHALIADLFHRAFDNPHLRRAHDGATFALAGRAAFTTDAFVVRPLVFPGGDIGALAVHGTANDLAMCGARPLYLSAAFVLEEGLPMEQLWRIARSMARAAAEAAVQIVTGDTKVVDRGKGDGVFIATAGVGVCEHAGEILPERVRPGDAVLLSGDVGRHGMAIMAVREGLGFESEITSDLAPLAPLVLDLLDAGIDVHCLRDLTRGGLATALNEIAATAGVAIEIEEAAVPVREDVAGACEILGLDPLYVACEGRLVAFVPAGDAARALARLRAHPLGAGAARIGTVGEGSPPLVTCRGRVGTRRILDLLSGEQLPRIC